MQSELEAIAESLSQRLKRAVAIDDPTLKLLVYTAHRGVPVDQVRLDAVMQKQTSDPARDYLLAQGIASAKRAKRIPGREDLHMLARVCAPVRHQNELLAYLWLLDDGALTPDDLRAADDAAREAGAVLYRERLLGDLKRGRERETLRDLLTEDEAVRQHAAESMSGTPLAKGPVVAVVVRPIKEVDDLETALQRAVRTMPAGSCAYLARVDHGVVLTARSKRVEGLAQAMLDECEGAAIVGIGDPAADLVNSTASYTQARRAIEVAAVVPSLGPIASWSRLGVYGLLVQLNLHELPVEALPASVQKLFEVDKSGALTKTLETYLDYASDSAAAVAALHIHRTTLYYRLARISELTGLDLKDGGERLAVHLGLKLSHLVGR